MPKLNIVWKCRTHRVHRYKNGRHSAFRLDHNGRFGKEYRVTDTHLLAETVEFETAKDVCLSDLAMLKGLDKFLYQLEPTPTHEVIENEAG